jgi:hypothetical protein
MAFGASSRFNSFNSLGESHVKKVAQVLMVTAAAGMLFASGALAASRYPSQPHMTAALESLQQAMHHLQEAEHDKGGHRADAAKLTSQAIEQVKMGIVAGEEAK